jgi:hypothetical protein
MRDKDAFAARRSEIAKITKESQDQTGLRSDVVTLYQGGEYWLYRYKKYTDVRLVFAPRSRVPSSAAIRITSPIPAMHSIWRCSASTKTTSRRSPRII